MASKKSASWRPDASMRGDWPITSWAAQPVTLEKARLTETMVPSASVIMTAHDMAS